MSDLDLALEATARASTIIRHYFATDVDAEMKGAVDPVTAADRDAEQAIIGLLTSECPDDSILGEESGEGGSRPDAARRWYIDPLDGTVNFANRIPHCSVSVALYDDGRPVVGVIRDVFRDETFAATADGPATLDDRKIRVRTNTELGDAVVVTGFPYDRRERADEYAKVIATVLGRVRGLRRLGSAALDFAWVAAGRFDGYWEYGLGPWDAAAGRLIVESAGGRVSSIGGPLVLEPGVTSVVAANPALHAQLVDLLRPVIGDLGHGYPPRPDGGD